MTMLELPAVDWKGTPEQIGAELQAVVDALCAQLLGEHDREQPFGFKVSEDLPLELLACTDPLDGTLFVSPAGLQALQRGDLGAVAAVAHQVVHAIGCGPAYAEFEEQMLEEAATETIAQVYLDAFARSFGVATLPPAHEGPLYQVVPGDLLVRRLTATSVAVERFGKLAAMLEDLTGSDADPEEIEAAALSWAIRFKAIPGEERFPLLAEALAALDGDAPEPHVVQVLEDYLRGYLRQTRRSPEGYSAIRAALETAWGDPVAEPEIVEDGPAERWQFEIERLEAVTLAPTANRAELAQALAAASPEVAPTLRRSLEVRGLLWQARSQRDDRPDA